MRWMTTDAHRRTWLDRAIEFGPVLLLALAPLLFVRTGGEFENTPKVALLQIGAPLLLLLWLFRGRGEELGRRLSRLDLAVLGFLGAGLLSLIPAINRYEALPPLHRMFAAAAIYLVLSRSVNGARQAWMLYASMAASSIVVCVIGISQQWLGLDWIPQAVAPASTFANRNMAAHFVAICFPPAIGLAARAPGRAQRWIGASALAVGVPFLWMTRTHAAWVAVAICLALTPLAFSKTIRAAVRRRRGGLVAYLLVGLLIALAFAMPLYSAADAAGSLSLRVIFWRNTLEMVGDHPWFGVGLGNFKLLYPLYHRAVVVDWTFDEEHQLLKVHNDHLQCLAETGLVGLLAWLSLFGCGALLWRRLSRSSDTAAPCAQIAGFVLLAIFIIAAFSFPMQRAIPPFYLLATLGILGGLAASDRGPRSIGGGLQLLRGGATALMMLWLLSSAVDGRRALLREIHYSQGVQREHSGEHAAALKEFERARRQAPFDTDVLLRLAGAHIALGEWEPAVEPLEEVLRLHPHKVNAWANLGYCRQQLGADVQALKSYEQVAALLPDSAEAQMSVAGVYFERGDHPRAIEIYERAVELARSRSSLPGRRSETRVSRPRIALARAYIANGEYRRAIEQYELVLEHGEGTPELHRVLAALREQVGESPE